MQFTSIPIDTSSSSIRGGSNLHRMDEIIDMGELRLGEAGPLLVMNSS